MQEVRPLDGSKEAAHTAAVISELSGVLRGILEVGAPTSTLHNLAMPGQPM